MNSLTPHRHWFLRLYKERKRAGYYIWVAFARVRVGAPFQTLESAREELARLKHLDYYRQPCTDLRPAIPWSGKLPQLGGVQ